MNQNPTKTDRESSLVADEFMWDVDGSTEVHRFVGPPLEDLVRRVAPARLLDLGCGNGALTARVRPLVQECVGMDLSRSGLEIASRRNPGVRFECAAISEPLPVELRQRFDMVIVVEVIEHLLLPRQLFARAREALRPGGYLVVTTPYHGYLKNLALALVGKYDAHWHPLRDYGHVKFFSVATLRALFSEQGFDVDICRRVGRIPPLARSMILGGRLK